ncbi:MAG TPA: ABC transporter permease [Lacipirellulaceae bacterium]|jgi:ABC-2 type transport system permease protein
MTAATTLVSTAESQRATGLGPRRATATSQIAALWTLYKLTLRQHLHGKRWMVMVALFLLPACMAIVIRSTARDPAAILLEFMLGFMLVPQALLPLIALVYASGMIQDEQEEQTITYLLVRPIPKWAIYLMKLLATCTTAVLLTLILTVLTYAAVYLHTSASFADVAVRCAKAAAVHSLAVVAYCSLFGLISMFTSRVLVVGIIYTAIVEGVFANLPFGIRLATVIYYTRLIAYRMLDFILTNSRGAKDNLAAEAWQFDVDRDPQLLQYPSTATCMIVLLVATIVCAILAAWLCSRREFHVKVPDSH